MRMCRLCILMPTSPPPPPPPGLYHLPGVLRGWRVAGQWFLGWVPLLVEG